MKFSLLLLMLCLAVLGCEPQVPESGSSTGAPNITSAEEVPFPTTEMPQSTAAPSNALTAVSPEADVLQVTPVSFQKTANDEITLQLANWDDVQKLIAAQKGKIVVLDIWSSWCLPCVREYPHLVALQKKYPDQVVCISLNLNYDGSKRNPPESHVQSVKAFLVKQDSRLHNLLCTTPDEEVYETIDLAAIPVAYVYQADGTLKKRFDNETLAYGDEGFTYKQHIIPLVEELLKAQPQ